MQETATGLRIVNDAAEAESPTPEKARYAFPPRNGILHVILSGPPPHIRENGWINHLFTLYYTLI